MVRSDRLRRSCHFVQRASLLAVLLLVATVSQAAEAPAPAGAGAKAPPERTYSRSPFVHRIVVLDEDGAAIRPTKPDEPPNPNVSTKPMSQEMTCGKCHSDYPVMQQGWHFNFAQADAPHGRPGEPWLLTDVQTRTQLPLSYRGWKGTWHPYDVGINDFNFAKTFGRHHPGGGAMQSSDDLRFKMSGPLENDCLVCHTSDDRYDAAARAAAIATDQNFRHAPTLAAFVGKVQGQASRLRDNFDPSGPDARRAPKINYDPSRFDEQGNVLFNLERRVSNDRCYFCHTNVDVGSSATTAARDDAGLESRWTHDRDIHLVKGMLCVDCHKNGPDHMMVRGYEGEFEDRARAKTAGATPDPTIRTLTCVGCHYGTETEPGGRNAAPKPLHHGLPTLHFDELTCTACHSGPMPKDATTLVQTAMAHKLGLPRHHTADAAAPTIQQPVFIRVNKSGEPVEPEASDGKIAPHRIVFPSFWGRMWDDPARPGWQEITPMLPEQVLAAGAGVESILGEEPSEKEFLPAAPLSEAQIAQVLEKLAAAPPPKIAPADVITARNAPTTAPAPAAPATAATTAATAPTTSPASPAPASPASPAARASASGEPVFVTGMNAYKRGADGKVEKFFHVAAAPYAWPLAHDVRPAQQSLGARGCVECHAAGAPIFDGKVAVATVLDTPAGSMPMHEARLDPMGALRAFAATYPLRWPLIVIGYASAAVVLVVLLKQMMRAIGSRG